MSDYHVHLHPHMPAAGGPPPGEYPPGLIESFVDRAARRGVTELGFTEHLYRCKEAAGVLGRFWDLEPRSDLAAATERFVRDDLTLSIEAYVEAVVAAKDRGLPVKLGLELDFFPETWDAVLELVGPYPWDYLIGSVHWVLGWAIDSSDQAHEFARRGIEQAWADYFALETELARRGGVEVLAHVDVCKKFGHRPAEEPLQLYRDVVEAAAASGLAVEVSSQGLRNPAEEVYPAPTLLQLFHDAGVPITLASDAHEAEDAGHGTEEVRKAAIDAGYDSHLRFTRRIRSNHPLDRP
jgi:histidinol-phosphatase (PHP family)